MVMVMVMVMATATAEEHLLPLLSSFVLRTTERMYQERKVTFSPKEPDWRTLRRKAKEMQ